MKFLLFLNYLDENRAYKPTILVGASTINMTYEDILMDNGGLKDYKTIKEKFKEKDLIIRIGKYHDDNSGIDVASKVYSLIHRNKGIIIYFAYIDADTDFAKEIDNYFENFLNSIEFY